MVDENDTQALKANGGNRSLDWEKIYKIVAIIVLLAPSSIFLLYIFNYGYFSQLNIDLSQTPITWIDFINTSFIWLPAIFFLIFSYILIEYQFKRVEGFRSEEELTAGSPQKKSFYDSIDWLLPISAVVLIISFVFCGRYVPYHLTAMWTYSVIIFNIWLSTHKNYQTRISTFSKIAIPLFTITFCFFYFFGRDTAHANYIGSKVIFEESTINQTMTGETLRIFDQFVLFKSKDGSIVGASLKSNFKIKLNKNYAYFKGILYRE